MGNGVYRLTDDANQRLAYAAGPPQARWVFLEGRVYIIDVSRRGPVASGAAMTRRGPSPDDEMALASPMPATVASINVVAGQDVSQGDVLVMLEAMKMQLPIKAPRDGRVRVVACSPGEIVQPGVPLVELE